MVPSQQWDTKPRERLKQTRGTGECEETGSGKIVCQCWSPWQGLILDSEFGTWLTPYIQTWKEMEQKVSSETPDFVFFWTVWLGMKWRAHSTKDAWRVLTEAAGALSISTCLLSLGIVGQICTWYFSAKRCKWKTNDSFKTSNLTSVEGYKRSVLNNLFLSYLNNWEMASGLHFRHSQLKKEILTKFLKIYFTNKWGVFWVVKQYPNSIWEEVSARSYSQKVKLN